MRGIRFVVFALFLFSSSSDAAPAAKKDFKKTSDCSKKANVSCTYKYSVEARIKGGEEIDVTANVDIFCESVGIFKKEPAIRHCINVRDAVGRISNKGNKYDSDTEAPIKKLDKWFCFAQSSKTGKISGVFYPKKEKEWIVNIKKSIASTFQANYKGTTVATETDSQSKHKSHYKYYSEGNKQIQERRIDSGDVSTYAGKASTQDKDKTLYFHEHDKLEIDRNRRIQFSEGKSVLELGAEAEDKATASDTNDKAVPPLGAISDYKLELARCYKPPKKDIIEELTAAMASHECVVGDLLATINEGIIDLIAA
ncbi:PREDICTED: uncharacterized protein LOC105313049 [Amphimedon queenslandica]|uniref:Vitellogenin domain-containing protein n=1 Tax=Amphimedon queenslandica TaxID=400682 RepID=A0AAN0J8Z4_AMPQE|nr:PREDICTED: uncharacterized protein LOC105313049 [Amphimedon queenslandica]|eukprot:XP_019853201.1 PREDICTED: uncharacterized protein LOC105313049 [Amphimedon queenslandica]